MEKEFPVYYKKSERIYAFALALILLALPIGLFVFGCYTGDLTIWISLTAFGLFVTITAIFGALRNIFQVRLKDEPIFTIKSEGVEIKSGKIAKWELIKEAVIFNCDSDRLFGLRLKDKSLNAQYSKGDINSEVYGLPLAASFSSMNVTEQEIISIFRKRQFPVKIISKDFYLGDEELIQNA